MSKEIYISTTPHETRLAVVEDEQLAEIYFERENEYTLAGSIYNGKVTRVLPGMQSAFVDIGLERDAFLYVTDFMEEAGDSADFETEGGSRRGQGQSHSQPQSQPQAQARDNGEPTQSGERTERPDRPERGERGDRNRGRRDRPRPEAAPAPAADSTASFDEPIAPAPTEAVDLIEASGEEGGSRRWRGRRGRRRGRSGREPQPGAPVTSSEAAPLEEEDEVIEGGYLETLDAQTDGAIEIDLSSEPAAAPVHERPARREDRGRGRGGRDRHGKGDRGPRREAERTEPVFDNSYAGYYDEHAAPEPTGEPILLPGESIRKYRDPADVAAEDAEARRNAPPAADILTVAAPVIEVVGWDGGAVLPGESLGRHRNRNAEPQRGREKSRYESAAVPAPSPAAQSAAVVPAEPAVATEPAVPMESFDSPKVPETTKAPEETSPETPEQAAAEVSVDVEYEPEEGASASIQDAARRDLRRFEQPAEAAPEPETPAEEAIAPAPDATVYDLNASAEEPVAEVAEPVTEEAHAAHITSAPYNFTSLQDSGEMLSLSSPAGHEEPESGFPPLPTQDEAGAPNAIDPEQAVPSVILADAETTPVIVHKGTSEETDGDDAHGQPEVHTYGEGDFHEEEIEEESDGDDFEYTAATANVDDGEVEYEEETLEGSADLGSLLHEMTLDSHTAADEETDDDTTEEDEAEDESGGFTADDFGGEPAGEEAPAGTAGAEGEQRPRRDGQRRPGSRDRDRRGGRNSGGDRGRNGGGRKSMQTTDLPAINELLKPGQEILVQIAKEPIAKKGARITSHIALPGRFLVFMPTVNHTGVSRKISSDEERRRLKSILLSEKGEAQGGFIVRTAADGATEEELRNDLRFLIHLWDDIKARSEGSKSPALIYHDLNLVERILRDQVTDNFSAIWVDSEQEYERVLRFLQRFQPSLVRRVKLYTKETPLFEHFGVTAEIDKALKSKVWLKSGGSIVINQTEALVAIDINTGKYVGKTARLEDTILKTNLDAIPEIVRQIRLRDLGGIIVIDFIDMDERKNRAKVLQTLEDAMRTDRAPSKILPFNDFGLVIMTRKRVKQSLERTLCMPDPVTDGTGMIKSPITIANEIYVEMRKMHRHLEKGDVMLRVHPEVVKTLKLNGGKRLQELEEMTRKTILVKSDPSLSPEAFDIH